MGPCESRSLACNRHLARGRSLADLRMLANPPRRRRSAAWRLLKGMWLGGPGHADRGCLPQLIRGRRKRRAEPGDLGRVLIWTILVAAALGAAEVNIAPDALTQATRGFNTFEGELAYLTDGLYPGNSEMAGALTWPTKGNLVFQFDAPRSVVGIRLAIGENAGRYLVMAYLDARFGKSGRTEMPPGAQVVADAYDSDLAANTWVELAFPPGTETDYIEVITESGADIYEIEILTVVPEPTVAEVEWWGGIVAIDRTGVVLPSVDIGD